MSTFVYVSSAEAGEIAAYAMQADGALRPGAKVKVGEMGMPMAVSPDRKYLYAAGRTRPYAVHAYAIDPGSGALAPLASAPLAESCPYISLDRTGRYLLGASYGASLVSVQPVGADGRIGAPQQVIPVGRSAHSIRVDESNRYAYVPTLGSDQIFQFTFDARSGRLASNTPAVFQMKPGTGPRHFITSPDNRFLFVLSELLATVTSFALDAQTGLLAEVSTASGLPPDTQLKPGGARGAAGGQAGGQVGEPRAAPPYNTDNDIWAADIHLTPDGRFLYISERTSSTLAGFSVNAQTGQLAYLGSTPTERQPRGFAIDPTGKFLVAAGEKSETITIYAIDAASGALRPLGRYPVGQGANWVEIVSFD